jgi:DNA-binding response OmpR family regulator
MRVLVVEDNPALVELLVDGLRDEGHTADAATDGGTALDFALTNTYDAVVLDLMLPSIDGHGVLCELRSRGDQTPVLVLTAKERVTDRIHTLDEGADDYMVKPFAFGELLARLRALARRRFAAASTSVIQVGDLEVDVAARLVRRRGREIRLTAREFSVLECLALRKGRLVTRSALLEVLYDHDAQPESNVLDVYIGQLRRKLRGVGETALIHTRRGEGYILEERG